MVFADLQSEPSLRLWAGRCAGGLRAVSVGVWALGLAACGGDGPGDWPTNRPRIDWLRYLQQEPEAPTELQFALAFADGDGDAADGRLQLYLQDRETATVPTADLFAAQTPPLPVGSTKGVLEFVVGLESSVPAEARLRVAIELVDGAGRRSNRPSVELRVVGEEDGT